jgi:hypothetical protein
MKPNHTWRFLFVHILTTIRLVGGLGVENQDNALKNVYFYRDVLKRISTDPNQGRLMNLNDRFEIFCL